MPRHRAFLILLGSNRLYRTCLLVISSRRSKGKVSAHQSTSSSRTQRPSSGRDSSTLPPPTPRLRDNLEVEEVDDDTTDYSRHLERLGDSISSPTAPRATSSSRPPLPTVGQLPLCSPSRPTHFRGQAAAALLPDPKHYDENNDDGGESTPRARSPVRPTALPSSEKAVVGSGGWVPLSDEAADWYHEQLQQAERRGGVQQSEEANIRKALRESNLSAMEERNVRERLALRQRRREARGLPAEELSVSDTLRGERQARERQRQSDSRGSGRDNASSRRGGDFRDRSEARRHERSWRVASMSRYITSSSDQAEGLTGEESMGGDISDEFKRQAQEALEAHGEFPLDDLGEALRRSLLNTSSDGEGAGM